MKREHPCEKLKNPFALLWALCVFVAAAVSAIILRNKSKSGSERMERKHLYVKRKNPFVWLSAICMLAAAVTAVVLRSYCYGWWIGAAAVYLLALLVYGNEMLYKTAVSAWFLCIAFAWGNRELAVWMASGIFAVCYTVLISGKAKKIWLLPVCLAALGAAVYSDILTGILAAAAYTVLYPAIRVHNDGKFHPVWGDRIDGRRIRSAPAMEQITAYFMPERNGASNLFSESVEITEMERYVRRKRKEGLTGFGISHVIMAAYVRTVAKFPALNRFIAGQKIYSRAGDIALCMTVKKEMRADAPDSVIKVHLHPTDTAEDVYRKFVLQMESAKNQMQNTGADNTAAAFMMIPSLVLKFVIWLLKTLDYFGLLPRFLLEVSPFHGSVYFTSMGSLGIKPVYHHLYDFGTVPVFCAFGCKRSEEILKDGAPAEQKIIDLKFSLDERICDGFYYAKAIKYFLSILNHPEVLDEIPQTVEQDIH